MSIPERVVVTGLGAVTSQGHGVTELWRGFVDGNVAIREVEGLDMTAYRAAFGGEVRTAQRRHNEQGRLTDEWDATVEFALIAAEEAVATAGIPLAREGTETVSGVAATRWGVAVGTCNGGLRSAEGAWRLERAGEVPDWRQFLMIQPQTIAEALSAAFGLQGPALSVNTACASGAHAIAHAVEILRSDRADVMLVGGADAFNETVFAGFNCLESLSPIPAAPYSKDRQGLSLGEGSGMLVLAKHSIAVAADAPILAEILGYGLSADGHHPTAPHPEGEGAARALSAAFAATGVTPTDVAYVNGHGTGTPKNDSSESSAVRRAFGDAAEKVALSSVKSMVGHLLGAAGAVEGIATTLAVRDQVAPPTTGFTGPDPKCGLDAVPHTARSMPIDVAMSNNFAFAGANATVAFARDGRRAAPPPEQVYDNVVVTGVGVISPAGATPAEVVRSYRDGAQHSNGFHASTVDFDASAHLTPRQRRRMDRLGIFAVATSAMALDNAALKLVSHDPNRIGVVLGTGIGPVESLEQFTAPVLENGAAAANPAVFPNTVYNAAAGQVSMVLGVKGPTSTLTAAHAAGASAVCVAHDLLRTGSADALLCPAVDAFSTAALQAYRRIPLFSSGTYTLAEGGIALLLERESFATARGARILGRLAGYGVASDALGIGRWDPSGAGVERAMRAALAEADLSAGDLSTVWANAGGLPSVDRPEMTAIERLADGINLPAEKPKMVVGEPVGAGAQLSAAMAMQEWHESTTTGPVLVNSSSLGGTHTSLVLAPGME